MVRASSAEHFLCVLSLPWRSTVVLAEAAYRWAGGVAGSQPTSPSHSWDVLLRCSRMLAHLVHLVKHALRPLRLLLVPVPVANDLARRRRMTVKHTESATAMLGSRDVCRAQLQKEGGGWWWWNIVHQLGLQPLRFLSRPHSTAFHSDASSVPIDY